MELDSKLSDGGQKQPKGSSLRTSVFSLVLPATGQWVVTVFPHLFIHVLMGENPGAFFSSKLDFFFF